MLPGPETGQTLHRSLPPEATARWLVRLPDPHIRPVVHAHGLSAGLPQPHGTARIFHSLFLP